MWQKLLISFVMALLERLGEYLMKAWKEAKKVKNIVKKQKKKEKATEDAKTPEEIRSSHRSNPL